MFGSGMSMRDSGELYKDDTRSVQSPYLFDLVMDELPNDIYCKKARGTYFPLLALGCVLWKGRESRHCKRKVD